MLRDYRDYRASSQKKTKYINLFWGLFLGCLLAGSIRWGVHRFVVFPYVLPDEAMVPVLLPKQRVYVWRSFYSKQDLQRGRFVFMLHPYHDKYAFIRRIVALPGETIVFKKQHIYVNGKTLKDDWARRWESKLSQAEASNNLLQTLWHTELKLKPNEYFVLSENQRGHLDSRMFGVVALSKVKGLVASEGALLLD